MADLSVQMALVGMIQPEVSLKAQMNAAEILNGKTAYKAGAKITGTMPNNGAKNLVINDLTATVKIPLGYHDGSAQLVQILRKVLKSFLETFVMALPFLA